MRSVEMKFMRAFVTLCSLAFGSRGCEGQGGEILNVCSFVVYLLQNPLHASEDFSRWQVLAVGPKEGDVETACCQQVLLLTIRFAQLALDAVAVCGMLEMALWNANEDAYLRIVCAAENGVQRVGAKASVPGSKKLFLRFAAAEPLALPETKARRIIHSPSLCRRPVRQ